MIDQKFSKRVVKFCTQSQKLLDALSVPNTSPHRVANIFDVRTPYEVNLISCGVINTFWQAWNKLCREYWCYFIYGGELSSSNNITSISAIIPIAVNCDMQRDVWNFLVPTNSIWQRKYPRGLIYETQEPTWGSKRSLSEIAAYYQGFYTEIINLSSSLSMAGDVLDHIQKVRNASIHLNTSSCNDLKSLTPHYSFSRRIEYPIDYLYANELRTGKRAIQYWIDEVTTIAKLMSS